MQAVVDVFNAAVDLSYFLSQLKEVFVVCLPKANASDYTDVKCIRPISLTSYLAKVLEKLIVGRLAEVEKNLPHKWFSK